MFLGTKRRGCVKIKKVLCLIILIGLLHFCVPVQAFELNASQGQHYLFFCSWYIMGYYTLYNGFNFSKEDASKYSALTAIGAAVVKEIIDIYRTNEKDRNNAFWVDTSLDLVFDMLGIGTGIGLVLLF
ncbi:hypothetical protein AUJ66_06480 [Candidatus Desantisbacteria bacterium CG1_02_38_46]|uniref:Uncharacterized protein n=3 Tax=unclassified Candidatus Desantisiibacteriota TaxID=3106372 RepID=A0A2H9PEA8_9BACT|nr:MAG: hypothetical protein AUJ66_06480 [Candidatus Desantisbacteria bacterium CG1_02_38_46]PIU52026.1 MAG: hypothetical protein COS91_01400 [Candidatus Desantisbacteria bacterium CG07_land_8_20_14_0_80_39_15]PIZ17097.1 MAG: hypothetical protein COY51_01110 [Candidatus Desantisbacteria bacterium CG_4_10_14_0_8_um_filter_39_17]